MCRGSSPENKLSCSQHVDIEIQSPFDDSVATSFACHLNLFARGLSNQQKTILKAILHDAMGPWERLNRTPVDQILNPDEAELLDLLLANQEPRTQWPDTSG